MIAGLPCAGAKFSNGNVSGILSRETYTGRYFDRTADDDGFKGRAAIVCFPGIFYRGGAEQKIRKNLVDNNVVEAVIALAPNLFFGTTIAVNILVLAKNKPDTRVQFIDATGEEFFRKGTITNVMEDKHTDRIVELFASKANVPHIAETVDQQRVIDADYNLSVSAYVEPKDNPV